MRRLISKFSKLARLAAPIATLFLLFPASSTAAQVQICASGQKADNSGIQDATAAIQACLSNASVQQISLPKGTYLVTAPLIITKSNFKIFTSGLSGNSSLLCGDGPVNCAVIKTGSRYTDIKGIGAMLYAGKGVTGTTIDHVNFDGNRSARLGQRATLCPAGNGRIAYFITSTNTTIRYSGFFRALCNTALGLDAGEKSSNTVVTYSVFSDNGDHTPLYVFPKSWADGLSVGNVTKSKFTNKWFYNNSDVSFIIGGAYGAPGSTVVSGNTFVQTWQSVFAAFMATNWTVDPGATDQWADFQGMKVSNNTFNLSQWADIGIQIGVMPWGGGPAGMSPNNPQPDVTIASLRTMGGVFTANTISTQRQGINVSGGGTPLYPVNISGNVVTLSGARLPAGLIRTIFGTSNINVQNPGGDSFVTAAPAGSSNENWNGVFN